MNAMVFLSIELKCGLLLALAGLLTLTIRKLSASQRHLIWSLAMLGILLVPLFCLTFPRWKLAVLPEGSSTANWARPPLVTTEAPPVIAETAVVVHSVVAPTISPVEPSSTKRWPVSRWLTILWGAGVLLVLSPLMVGHIAARRLVGRSRPASGEWVPLKERLLRKMSIKRRVAMLEAAGAQMPMALGLTRPKIVLPETGSAWSEREREAVLAHELAHVKRRDCLIHFISSLALALHWFNPLAWIAMRRMRLEREHACDDYVLRVGAEPDAYADHLLTIARAFTCRPAVLGAAVTMARKNALEGRLLAILDGARNRKAMSMGVVAVAVLLLVGVSAPLAAVTSAPPVESATLSAVRTPAAEPVSKVGYSKRAGLYFHVVAEDPSKKDLFFSLAEANEREKALPLEPKRWLSANDVKLAYVDRSGLEPGIMLQLTDEGAARFEKLTASHIGRRIAIVLDGEILMAPTVMDRISGGFVVINGRFSDQEVERLLAKMDAVGIAVRKDANPAAALDRILIEGQWAGHDEENSFTLTLHEDGRLFLAASDGNHKEGTWKIEGQRVLLNGLGEIGVTGELTGDILAVSLGADLVQFRRVVFSKKAPLETKLLGMWFTTFPRTLVLELKTGGALTMDGDGRRGTGVWTIVGGRVALDIQGEAADAELSGNQLLVRQDEGMMLFHRGHKPARGPEAAFLGEWEALNRYAEPDGRKTLSVEKGGTALILGPNTRMRAKWRVNVDELVLETSASGILTANLNDAGYLVLRSGGEAMMEMKRAGAADDSVAEKHPSRDSLKPPRDITRRIAGLSARIAAAQKIMMIPDRDDALASIAKDAAELYAIEPVLKALDGMTMINAKDDAAKSAAIPFIRHGDAAEAMRIAEKMTMINAKNEVIEMIAHGRSGGEAGMERKRPGAANDSVAEKHSKPSRDTTRRIAGLSDRIAAAQKIMMISDRDAALASIAKDAAELYAIEPVLKALDGMTMIKAKDAAAKSAAIPFIRRGAAAEAMRIAEKMTMIKAKNEVIEMIANGRSAGSTGH